MKVNGLMESAMVMEFINVQTLFSLGTGLKATWKAMAELPTQLRFYAYFNINSDSFKKN